MLTHIIAIALAKGRRASEFIILSTREVVLTVVQSEGEAAIPISTNFYAELARYTHGAVKAISRLGEDSVEVFSSGSRCQGCNQQHAECRRPHDAMSDVSLRDFLGHRG